MQSLDVTNLLEFFHRLRLNILRLQMKHLTGETTSVNTLERITSTAGPFLSDGPNRIGSSPSRFPLNTVSHLAPAVLPVSWLDQPRHRKLLNRKQGLLKGFILNGPNHNLKNDKHIFSGLCRIHESNGRS